MKWPWQDKSVEPNSRKFPDIILCPSCGAIDQSEWLDALADIFVCTVCGWEGQGKEMRHKSPPGTLATHEEIREQ